MKKKLSLQLILLLLLQWSSKAQSLPGYDSLIRKLATDFETPGIVVAVLDGDKYQEYRFGYSNLESRKPVSSKTVFNVASVSKLLTGIAVMQLAEKGMIDLDKPIEEYLTRWKLPSAAFDSRLVTVRRVLNHSAGLSSEFGPGFTPKDSLLPLVEILSGKSPKRKPLIIETEPGKQHVYSNPGFGLLQLLIEEISGMSFAGYMKKNIFDKLNMSQSGFTDPLVYPDQPDLATPYDYRLNALDQERFVVLAAAGLLTTLSDLEKMMLEETTGQHLLRKETYEKMIDVKTPEIYGLAHIIHRYKNETAHAGHTGLGSGWNSSYQFIPGTKKAIIVLTNGDNGFYIHNTLVGYWYYTITGKRLESCKTAPDKKLNRISLFIEIATEEGLMSKEEANKSTGEVERARNALKENDFSGFGNRLSELEKKLNTSITDKEILKNLKEGFTSCYYWIGMPWFNQ